MQSASQNTAEENRDAVLLLYKNSYSGLFISAITISVLAFGFEIPKTDNVKLWIWVAMLVVLALRLADSHFWKKQFSINQGDPQKAGSRYLAGVLITAILWSAYLIFIVRQAEFIELATCLIVISAMAGGAATILAASRPAALLYSAILMIPSSIFLLSSGDSSREFLGFLGLLFSGVMVMSAKKAVDFTHHAIQLKNHNRLLVEKMEGEVAKRTEQIRQLSNLDPLTGLYNRNAFIQALRNLLSRGQKNQTQTALLFIDLDGFKQINDALGHQVGDQVLKIVTQRILSFREAGIVGRWGGDEFVLAFPDCDESQSLDFAAQVVAAIKSPIRIKALKLNIGASVGISFAPEHSRSEHELIQFADIAMYKQKNSGELMPRIFSNELFKESLEKERLLEGLRDAIAKKELFVEYQPIFDSGTRQIVSCEALLRWSFQDELISPSVFIEIAEQTGSIIEIGHWVLNRACHDAMNWGQHNDAKVSVNVSIVQLLDGGFLEFLDDVLKASELPAKRLVIEITESTFVDNEDYIKRLLTAIKARNIGVSIDDFGTGYSSMSQLQVLSFDIIKIDRSFVNNIHDKGQAIIKATLFMARELGCQTIAEGVETEDQAEQLKLLGANYLQGFLLARPMGLAQLVKRMQTE
jgi:diguanylate cyclase